MAVRYQGGKAVQTSAGTSKNMSDAERNEVQAAGIAVRGLKDRVNALMRMALDADSIRATKYAQAAKQLDAAYEALSAARAMNGR